MNDTLNVAANKVQLLQRGERFEAMFTFPHPKGVKGCPLGIGLTAQEATEDLLERASRESGIALVIHE